MKIRWTVLVTMVACIGCGGPATPERATTEEAVFSRTVVRFDEQGVPRITSDQVTPAQQQAEHQMRTAIRFGRRTAEPETVGTGTNDCQLWGGIFLFDRPGFVGNELCFQTDLGRGGIVNLDNYCRVHRYIGGCASWGWVGHVASYEAGIPGYFIGTDSAYQSFDVDNGSYTPWQPAGKGFIRYYQAKNSSASPFEQWAISLQLSSMSGTLIRGGLPGR